MPELPAIRDDFPALASGRAYLDNAATTHQPRVVLRAVSDYIQRVHGTPDSATAYADARARIARHVGAAADNVVFCGGATQAIQLVADGFDAIGVGDEIIVSSAEHIANLAPWQRLAAQRGARLRVVDVDANGVLTLDAFRSALSERTKFVAITHVSNVLGTTMPVSEIVDAAHAIGARVLIDGAQAIAHGPVNFAEIGVDFYVFSGHKVFAPTGVGVLLATHEMLATMRPPLLGAQTFATFTLDEATPAKSPERFEGGTSNVAGAIGLAVAFDYVASIGWNALETHTHHALHRLDKGLAAIDNLRVLADNANSIGVRSFVVNGRDSVSIQRALAERGVDVRAGHLSAGTLLRQFGTAHAVRVSIAPYNNNDDIDRFLNSLRDAVR
ncbi:MAG TPA: aminotransferase class V-fold PLP-dependent enzyme [Rudaea sp.]|nr:aminotransferase class V-fold PLP-dependent enzyme [Rudaea sp.]